MHQMELKSVRQVALEEAISLTEGDRNKEYGPPYYNMQMIADLWSIYLGFTIQPHQVPICMVLTKVARTTQTFDHRDSHVDGAAYFAIALECAQGDPAMKGIEDEAA